ncbi:MAG: metallophosphoesterase family protein [Candidatus Omnitrophica bacterium]|nr:metallophosphoesterase family protein [Candidatus Omnitrophota bacterium]
MRYGIFSDVHSNLEAFKVVSDYLKRSKLDRLIFIGDIIGYGPRPAECISLLRDINPVLVTGNHEWGILDKLALSYFNPDARASLVWTRKQITSADIKYLSSFSLSYENEELICVHGSLSKPDKFYYIASMHEAELSFSLMQHQICFVGHSHRAGIYSLSDGFVVSLNQRQIDIEPEKKYIVNVGSVGQPRDMNNRASVCVYDSSAKTLRIDRLEYNLQATASEILKLNLPSALANRLYEGW